ncbi:hypothetical protein IRJ41_009979, partial [Triplophysa rosa]
FFNTETSSKLLERWDTAFKPRIIEEAMDLLQLLLCPHFFCQENMRETVSSVL